MITCPNCGHQNADDARYCGGCRVNLGDAAPKDTQGRPQYEQRAAQGLWERVKRLVKSRCAG